MLVAVAAEGAPPGADFYKGFQFNGVAMHALPAPSPICAPALAVSTPPDYKQKKGVRPPLLQPRLLDPSMYPRLNLSFVRVLSLSNPCLSLSCVESMYVTPPSSSSPAAVHLFILPSIPMTCFH
ncbi:unnamed protein product [Danaus chrysippus]|uniref:(African queen) hypothetical protein n=1 Tax=Danaus chrysippus TaxID=151541 RepID=A0A8J2WA12_9NEOP|nr:unnamed protein product [Danaus chrysippus]